MLRRDVERVRVLVAARVRGGGIDTRGGQNPGGFDGEGSRVGVRGLDDLRVRADGDGGRHQRLEEPRRGGGVVPARVRRLVAEVIRLISRVSLHAREKPPAFQQHLRRRGRRRRRRRRDGRGRHGNSIGRDGRGAVPVRHPRLDLVRPRA